MGSKFLLRFRSETNGLNEELGRHSTRNSKACFFCECECESVEHVLWECSEYSSIRKKFIRNLDDWFSNTKAFLCSIWNLCREEFYPSGSSDLVLHSSIN